MSITMAEKNHWRERIAEKIERAVKELIEQHDPWLMERIAEEATKLAVDTLGGTEYVKQIKMLEAKREELNNDIAHIEQRLADLAKKAGAKPKPYYYNALNNIALWNDSVALHQRHIEKRLLAKDRLGQRILKLRGEQEALLDTVWLSTSTVQIRDLWRNVTELLADDLSELQKQVLAGPAVEAPTK